MTIPLEHIQEGDWAAVNRTIDLLRSLVLDTGGVSLGVRTGASSVTFAAGATADKVISHGLGRVPVWADAKTTNSTILEYQLLAATATTMTFRCYTTTQVTTSATFTFDWVAIG